MRNVRVFIKKHKKATSIILAILVFIVAIVIYAIIGVFHIKSTVNAIQADMTQIKVDQNSKSLPKLVGDLKQVNSQLNELENEKNYFFPLQVIPFLNIYYANAGYAINGAKLLDGAFINIIQSSVPLADALGYGAQQENTQGKIGIIVNALPAIADSVNGQMESLQEAQKNFNAINPSYIPNVSVKGTKLQPAFIQYRSGYNDFIALLPKLTSISSTLESAFGSPTPKNYLLLLENDKELRPGGGFITAYGYLNFNKGNLGKIATNNIYYLDGIDHPNVKPPVQIQQYIIQDSSSPIWYMRDANYSPDIPTDAKVIEQMYSTIPSSKVPPIDGVVFINTQLVASILNVTGPIYVSEYKQTVSSSTASYLMEYYAEKVDVNNPTNNKKFINYFLSDIESKIFSLNKGDLVNFMQFLIEQSQQRNVMAYANDSSVESVINTYNFGGAFPKPNSNDFIGIADANVLSGKSDFYIHRSITQSVKATSKGVLETVNITFINDHVGDGWLNHNCKTWLRVYVPQGSKLLSMTGDDQYYNGPTRRVYDELGYTVFDTHLTVPLKNTLTGQNGVVTLALSYYLPPSFKLENHYSLSLFKQSGIADISVASTFNGNTQKADMIKDTTISF